MSAFNGSGTFVISGTGLPYVTGTTISSTVANQLNNDLAQGLSNCITRDGQSPPTQNLPLGGFTFTNMGPATGVGQPLIYDQDNARLKRLGLGTEPTNILDSKEDINSTSLVQFSNPNNGTVAQVAVRAQAQTAYANLGATGPGYATVGILASNMGYVSAPSSLALFTGGASPLLFGTNSTEGMRLIGKKLGVGVAPLSNWNAAIGVVEVGPASGSALFSTGITNTRISANIIFDSANYVYAASDFGSIYEQHGGGHNWSSFPTGIGGNAATALLYMQLSNVGNLSVNRGTIAAFGPPSGTGYSLILYNGSSNNDVSFEQANGLASPISGTVRVSKQTANGRSINATGTINASGTDYAEYELKDPACGVIAAGQIIGFTADGKITDQWASAISFGVKSTDPSFVGGDAWVTPLLPRPEPVQLPEGSPERAAAEAALVTWFVDFEALRQTVDRIAYCGKVPVNVLGAAPGDYIVAVQNGAGIDGQIVAVPTLAQLLNCVGRVRSILPDGRARISVMMR